MDYILNISVFVLLFAILAKSVDLVGGHLGLMAICCAAFYGLGAYGAALVTVGAGMSFGMGLLTGVALGCLGGLTVSVLSLRLKDDFFVLGTLGFQVLLSSVFANWDGLTRGSFGIMGVPRPTIFGTRIDKNFEFALLGLLAFILAQGLTRQLTIGPLGRVMHSIREDETLALALGKDVFTTKVATFVVSGGLAAFAGVLYAHYITFIEPSSFSVSESVLIVSMAIIGGSASNWRPPLGALVLVSLPEILRWLGLPAAAAGHLRQIFYGLALVFLMQLRPQGLLGKNVLSRSS